MERNEKNAQQTESIRTFVESKADCATNAERLRKNVSVGSNLFHLYNGLLAELLKRLAELQWQEEAKTVGNDYTIQVQLMILILSTAHDHRPLKAMLYSSIEVEPR